MRNKRWRVVVAEFGGSSSLGEATVDAPNWMSALQNGRARLGEEAVVPRGSSCSVAADGKVTVHDPLARRVYTVTPDTTTSFAAARTTAPRIPGEQVPRRPEASATGKAAPSAKPFSGSTNAGFPAPASASAASRPEPAPLPVGEDDLDLSATLERPLRTQSYLPPAPTAMSSETAARSITELDPPDVGQPPRAEPELNALARHTVRREAASAEAAAKPLYTPPIVPVGASQRPTGRPETPRADTPAPDRPKTPASDTPAPAPASEPAIAAVPPPPSPNEAKAYAEPPVAPAKDAAPPANDQLAWESLTQRDEDPTPETPLHYRERTYYVPEGTTGEAAEAMLRARLAALRAELAASPAGKYVNLAAFDHRWTGKPRKSPLVALQWKDWRGEPLVTHRSCATRPSTVATMLGAAQAAAKPEPQQPVVARVPSQHPRARKVSAPPVARTSEIDLRLTRAFEAAQDLLFFGTPVEALEYVTGLVHDLVACEAVTAMLYDINTDEFRFVALDGPGAEALRGKAVPSNAGLLAQAVKRELPLDFARASGLPEYSAEVDGRPGIEIRSVLYRPLIHAGRLLGMLQLINRERRESFSKEDISVLGYIADHLAQFLHSIRIAPEQTGKSSEAKPAQPTPPHRPKKG